MNDVSKDRPASFPQSAARHTSNRPRWNGGRPASRKSRLSHDQRRAGSGERQGSAAPIIKAATEAEIDAAFSSLVQRQAGALIVGTDPFFVAQREQLVALAAHYRLPAAYDGRLYAEAGGLISYGTDLTSVNRLHGTYVGKVLKGAKPGDLPVQQPTKFELIINLKTANTLALTVPQSML